MEELEELREVMKLFEICRKFGGEIVIGSAGEVPAVLEGVSVIKQFYDFERCQLLCDQLDI